MSAASNQKLPSESWATAVTRWVPFRRTRDSTSARPMCGPRKKLAMSGTGFFSASTSFRRKTRFRSWRASFSTHVRTEKEARHERNRGFLRNEVDAGNVVRLVHGAVDSHGHRHRMSVLADRRQLETHAAPAHRGALQDRLQRSLRRVDRSRVDTR